MIFEPFEAAVLELPVFNDTAKLVLAFSAGLFFDHQLRTAPWASTTTFGLLAAGLLLPLAIDRWLSHMWPRVRERIWNAPMRSEAGAEEDVDVLEGEDVPLEEDDDYDPERAAFELHLDEPWGWCDARCWRCPLALDCARRPALPKETTNVTGDRFKVALAVLAEARVGRRPVERASSEAHALAEATRNVAMAVEADCRSVDSPWPQEGMLSALVLAKRCEQLASLEPLVGHEDGDRAERVLMLLLFDLLLREADLALPRPRSERMHAALAELRALLDRSLVTIPDVELETINTIVAEGEAPSPFCVTAPAAGRVVH